MNRPIAEIGRVTASDQISPGLWDIEVEAPGIASETRAGQFVHVRVSDNFNPFLRRPLSVGPIRDGKLRLIFHVRGEGTRLLSLKRPGAQVDLIGPLGGVFDIPEDDSVLVFLTGGIGVVPLLLLDDQLPKNRERAFILGVRSFDAAPVTMKEATARHIQWASDDGSVGFHGNSVQLLWKVLNELEGRPARVIGCGPGKMLVGMKRLCQELNISASASLEVPMGCGVGACQSCAVPRTDGKGYLLVCKDGPIFDCDRVVIEPEVLP